MKKKERRPEGQDRGSEWLNAMCEVLKGGVLAGVTAILALLACSVLVSVGVMPVGAMYGDVMAVCVAGALVGNFVPVGIASINAMFAACLCYLLADKLVYSKR